MAPAARHPGQDHNHVRNTTRSPPVARPQAAIRHDPSSPGLPHRPAVPGRQDQAVI